MFELLACLFATLQAPEKGLGGSEPTWDVATFVRAAHRTDGGNWIGRDGFRRAEPDVEVAGLDSEVETEMLVVQISDFNGYFGSTITLVFERASNGHVRARGVAEYFSDAGAEGFGPGFDLSGIAQLIHGGPAPSLAFRLHAVGSWCGEPDPLLYEGHVPLPTETVDFVTGLRESGWLEADSSLPLADLEEVRRVWADGSLRASGWVDRYGLRQGVWITCYPGGEWQTKSAFVDGERTGPYTSYRRGGRIIEQGQFHGGRRVGRWIESSTVEREHTTSSGTYVDGRREGEWIGRWESGHLRSVGSYREGLQTGAWSRWRSDGRPVCGGRYDKGAPVGEWTYWNDDGSVREVVTRFKMPWTR